MATTSLMAIRGQLAHVVNYVKNPDKTANPLFEDLRAALHYAENDRKTEQRHFVSGINCEPDTAYQLMLDSFKMNDKPIRVICYHGYQSFAEGEVDAATAHEIGMRLAQEMWGDKPLFAFNSISAVVQSLYSAGINIFSQAYCAHSYFFSVAISQELRF